MCASCPIFHVCLTLRPPKCILSYVNRGLGVVIVGCTKALAFPPCTMLFPLLCPALVPVLFRHPCSQIRTVKAGTLSKPPYITCTLLPHMSYTFPNKFCVRCLTYATFSFYTVLPQFSPALVTVFFRHPCSQIRTVQAGTWSKPPYITCSLPLHILHLPSYHMYFALCLRYYFPNKFCVRCLTYVTCSFYTVCPALVLTCSCICSIFAMQFPL